MTTSGILPIVTEVQYLDTISGRAVIPLRAFATRTNVSTAVNGDDIWTGTATTLPIPPDVGEQMQVVSTSASDTSDGTGARQVELHYIDANGNQQSETIIMNGITPVLTAATNIRFVQELHVVSAGTNLLAVGTITISKAGAPATVYTQISPGTNASLNTARMVPVNKVLLITGFNATGGAAAGGKSADARLRATVHHGTLLARLFQFQDNILVFNSGQVRPYEKPIVVPAFGIVKITSYAAGAGADVQAGWEGFLVDTPK